MDEFKAEKGKNLNKKEPLYRVTRPKGSQC